MIRVLMRQGPMAKRNKIDIRGPKKEESQDNIVIYFPMRAILG
jgi:hypothetical protein